MAVPFYLSGAACMRASSIQVLEKIESCPQFKDKGILTLEFEIITADICI